MSAEDQLQEDQLAQERVTNLASLADAVNVKDFDIWQRELLKNFGNDADKITKIINAVSADVPTGVEGQSILESFKQLQTKYVHVSLFASLSYVYITKLLEDLKTKFEVNKLAAVQRAQKESSVQVQAQLEAKAKEYSELEEILQQRAQGLNQFITDYSNKLASETAEAKGGSKRKKRAQKGGFIRDGTRANLAGDPYPKAS